ncbi:glycoside hydrolase family 28 protein [Lepidopterella palustris CBS 459.81]|uniref:Glycoside hydrolase family 28 protein n=1 Tax=Lepidopterella palustris CBS 459.81 TaxID=1314670 RepID=A0A8E2E9Q7_9PEZI|nr:glycoside hydrolase family 28 protein [Lepidopterella palustris CBS 459.81]
MHFFSRPLLALALLPPLIIGQLSGTVGPLTAHATNSATNTYNILSLPECLSFIPSGNYAVATWVTLSGGSAWALHLDGIVYRAGIAGGNVIFIEHSNNFELFNCTSKGACKVMAMSSTQKVQYLVHEPSVPTRPPAFSVYDIILVNSPAFHFSIDTCTSGEGYNVAICGGDEGGWPCGCALGSLGACPDIPYVTYKNVYTWPSNQMMMIKSTGGSVTVSNVMFENFVGHRNACFLDIDQCWSVSPCQIITISNFIMWTDLRIKQWCSYHSAYGSGFCQHSGSTYTSYSLRTTNHRI